MSATDVFMWNHELETMPRGELRGMQFARLKVLLARVLDGPDKGAAWEGDRGSSGSAKDNALTLGDPNVSGYHVELIAEKSGIRVADHGSTNGT